MSLCSTISVSSSCETLLTVNAVSKSSRINLLMAVIEKRLGIRMGDCDAYINVAGGMRINEPALDLGIVAALLSSYKNITFDSSTICSYSPVEEYRYESQVSQLRALSVLPY